MTEVTASARKVLSFGVPAMIMMLLLTGVSNDLQGTALNPLIGTVIADLGISGAQMSWAITSTTLAATVCSVFVARLGDRYGQRRILITMLVIGIAGSVVGGLASGFLELVISRVALGIALTTPLAWGLLKVRANTTQVQSAGIMLGTVIAVFTPIALLTGGLFLEIGLSWNSIFWVIAGLKAVTLLLAMGVPETPRDELSTAPIQIIGAAGLGLWLFLLLLGITQGSTWGWSSTAVLGSFAGAAVAFGLWALRERGSSNPVLDFDGMNLRQLATGIFMIANVSGAMTIVYIAIPRIAQMPTSTGYGMGLSVLGSAALLIPMLPGGFLANRICGWWMPERPARTLIITGGILAALGFAAIAVADGRIWLILVAVFVVGIGTTCCYNIGWAMVGAAGRKDNTSATVGFQYVVTYASMALMAAIGLAILQVDPATLLVPASAFLTAYGLCIGLALVFFTGVGVFLSPKDIEHYSSRIQNNVAATKGSE